MKKVSVQEARVSGTRPDTSLIILYVDAYEKMYAHVHQLG